MPKNVFDRTLSEFVPQRRENLDEIGDCDEAVTLAVENSERFAENAKMKSLVVRNVSLVVGKWNLIQRILNHYTRGSITLPISDLLFD